MADVSSLGLWQDVLIIEAPVYNGVIVEILAETEFTRLPELRATVVGRHALVRAQQTVEYNDVHVEVLANDPTFVPLPEMKASVVGRHALTRAPMQVPVMRYAVEVLAETELEPLPAARAVALWQDVLITEKPTPDVNVFTAEVLAASKGFEPEAQTFMVEVLGGDTTPNSVARFTTEVLADSTDDVALTGQQIVWFFGFR